MGYYGNFTIEFTILAENVESAEKALRESLQKSGHRHLSEDDTFCDMLNTAWGENIAHEEKVAPLVALAAAADDKAARGEIYVEGGVHKKWRSWEEESLAAIASFVEQNGSVSVVGEEGERVEWHFREGELHQETFSHYSDAEVEALRAKAAKYDELTKEKEEKETLSVELDGTDVSLYRHEQTGILTVDICTCDIAEEDMWDKNAVPKLRILVNEDTVSLNEDGELVNGNIFRTLSGLERLARCAE